MPKAGKSEKLKLPKAAYVEVTMKIVKLFIIIYSISIGNIFSQIDTTDIYPLQIGNYWEFKGSGRHYYEKVIGTELMPNGKVYKVLETKNFDENATTYYFYRRVEDNSRVYYYDDRNGTESKNYDINLPVGSAWYIPYMPHRRIIDIKNEYYALIQDTTIIYYMDYVNIDSSSTPPDTNWTHLYDDFAVGVGQILKGDMTGYWTLRGAIIDGVVYGDVNIKHEEPLSYYPLEIGNQWTYKVLDVNTWENDTSDTYHYRTDEVVSETVLNDGYKYFEIKQGGMSSYYLRIDSLTKIIYDPSGYEFINLGAKADSLWIDNGGVTNNMYYDTSRVGELNITRPLMVFQQGYLYFNRTLAQGIGHCFTEYGDLGLHTLEILVYAKIDGMEYGTPVGVEQKNNLVIDKYELSQNYPNPFNPTTTLS